jgi:diaminopropionate ammonia-lyase
MFDRHAAAAATGLLGRLFAYTPTPLVNLPALAGELGLASLCIKDEGARLGLKSFKALGGAYAVIQWVLMRASEQLGRAVSMDELPRPASGSLALPATGTTDRPAAADLANLTRNLTFCCATDGNHGLSVAAGARLMGARAVILVHEGVSEERRRAIARYGAEVREVAGTYDEAVAESLRLSASEGWTLLSDTSWPGYEQAPRCVMQGYTVMAHELARQLPQAPTHVFLQAGVGGFAAALAACLTSIYEASPPRFVIVEPARAACLLASAQTGHAIKVPPGQATMMSMLECYEPSMLAWDVLRPLASAFMTVDEADAAHAMRRLALSADPKQIVVAGESGAAGLAGVLAAHADPAARAALELGAGSRVLTINTESATDAERYEAVTGVSPADVTARKAAR